MEDPMGNVVSVVLNPDVSRVAAVLDIIARHARACADELSGREPDDGGLEERMWGGERL